VVGYMLVSDPRFLEAVRRDLVPALVVGVVGFAILGALDPFAWAEAWAADPTYTPSYFLMLGLFSLQGAWAVAALSVAMRVGPLRQAAAGRGGRRWDALLPGPPAGDLGAGILHSRVGDRDPGQLIVLLVLSLAGSAVAAWLLSRAAVARRLLGVKPRRSPPVRRS
jgi:hypothetical protein